MEDVKERRGWFSRHRRLIATCSIFIIIYLTFSTPFIIHPESFYASHPATATIGPLSEEMSIYFVFYSSEPSTDAGGNKLCGFGSRLDALDSEQQIGFGVLMFLTANTVWVMAYFEDISGTAPSVIRSISLGQTIYFSLQGIEISLFLRR